MRSTACMPMSYFAVPPMHQEEEVYAVRQPVRRRSPPRQGAGHPPSCPGSNGQAAGGFALPAHEQPRAKPPASHPWPSPAPLLVNPAPDVKAAPRRSHQSTVAFHALEQSTGPGRAGSKPAPPPPSQAVASALLYAPRALSCPPPPPRRAKLQATSRATLQKIW
jgi:hypothetical protein